ncbi:MAG TPA: two-component regulator propeller domain-containing protein [Opitutaceae bacterium]|nr:two-component regulator propeller domain-containing protein [Opitutaceae bacterium]
MTQVSQGSTPAGYRCRQIRLRRWIAASTLLGLAAIRAPALDPRLAVTQYAHDTWQLKDGLPASAVECLAQTPDGYLWLGTPAGLVRFDGVRFTDQPTHPEDPLRRETILSLGVERDGTLWIGTRAAGLRRWKGETLTPVRVGIMEDPVRTITLDARGGLHVGGPGGLYARQADGSFLLERTTNAVVVVTFGDRKDRLWVATHGGIDCIERGARRAVTLPSTPEAMLVDARETVWIGTFGGLYRAPSAALLAGTAPEQVLPDHVWTVFEDRAGNVWVGTTDALIRFRGDAGGRWLPRDRLPIRETVALAEDREGSLWVGTRDGLHRLKDVNVTPWTASEGLLGNTSPSLIETTDGALYVFNSTEPSGATRFTNNGLSYVNGISDGPSYAAADGTLWVGTTGVLYHLRGDQVERYGAPEGVPPNWISAINADDGGLILSLATYGGICRWSPGASRPYRLRDGTAFKVPFHVMTMHRHRDGALWMGGYDGLWCFRNGEVTRYTTSEGVSAMQSWLDEHPGTATYSRTVVVNEMADRCITSIAEDTDGTLWFASLKGGLTRLKDGVFTPFAMRHGLFSNQLFCVLVDDNHDLWLSCPRGIFRVRGEALAAVAAGQAAKVESTVFTTSDGMKNEECMNEYQPAGWKRRDGTVWFATRLGVVSIDPRRLRTNPFAPTVLIEQMTADGHPVPAGPPTELPAGTQSVSFRYTALSLLAPERVRFRYVLEGFDRNWIDAGTERFAHYPKLPPGDHRFRVTACNNDGVWNEMGASVAFRIEPFFYETAWFYALAVGLIATAAAGAHRWRVRRLRAHESELQRHVVQRTAELSQANIELTREVAERERAEKELRRAHQDLMLASRQAGMAEVATGVLHNVGNVLNSVNVSVSVALEHLRGSRAGNVRKIAALLREHAADPGTFLTADPRGQQLPTYLGTLGDVLVTEQETLRRELEEVRKNIDHIKEIVAMQQSYARLGGVMEPVAILDVVEDAIQVNRATLERHDIHLVRDYATQAVVTTDRHKVVQILVNLLRNAKLACDEGNRPDRQIAISVSQNAEFVVIAVKDNGIGIPRENLVRIFSHGFTTRKGGHGFGLHSAAIAARELGGSLTVESAGTGLGATFQLFLPLKPPPPS